MKGTLTMIEEILKQIWSLSPRIHEHESYLELSQLTQDLIKQYDLQGRLASDPFSPSRERTLSLPFEKINNKLYGSTCVVTGGLGCVGSRLVDELLKFDVRSIVILDFKQSDTLHASKKVVRIDCDIRDLKRMEQIFTIHKPDFVFHTAAQRNPGLAELHVEETVSINVTGTLNVVRACENSTSVKQLVWSSTGKASRYFTEEVYAGTKKMGEFILDNAARTSKIKYSMVRCTHILDNSLMNEELKVASLTKDYVTVHSPGKYVTAQNAKEAAYLMLNALIYSEEKQCKFLLVRHLEWPVESLEMALYYIKQSGESKPIIFEGNPMGYSEKFFRGQLDWSSPTELNLLINVYERKNFSLSTGNDIIISIPCATNSCTLEKVLNGIEKAKGEKAVKTELVEGLKEVVRESLKKVGRSETLNILKWGTDTRFLEMEKTKISDFDYLVPLLVESLKESESTARVVDLPESRSVYATH